MPTFLPLQPPLRDIGELALIPDNATNMGQLADTPDPMPIPIEDVIQRVEGVEVGALALPELTTQDDVIVSFDNEPTQNQQGQPGQPDEPIHRQRSRSVDNDMC